MLTRYARIYLFAEKFLTSEFNTHAEAGLWRLLAGLDICNTTVPYIIEVLELI